MKKMNNILTKYICDMALTYALDENTAALGMSLCPKSGRDERERRARIMPLAEVKIIGVMCQMIFQPLLVLRLRHFKWVTWTPTDDQMCIVEYRFVFVPGRKGQQ